jgi:four helix bundle protein
LYALTNQRRRAAVSVPSNIAEGQVRGIGGEFARFLRISVGSLQEAQTQMLVAERLQYVRHEDVAPVFELSEEAARITRGLLASVAPD